MRAVRLDASIESLAANVREQFLLGMQCSSLPSAWIAARALLMLPFQARGEARRLAARLDGDDLPVVSVGCDGKLRLVDRLFEDVREEERIGRRALWHPRRLGAAPAQLVVAEIPALAAPRFRSAGWAVVPHWIRWQADLSATSQARPGHSLADDLRKVRNGGYTIDHAGRSGDWDEFFGEMVRPLARERFGSDGWIPSPWLRRRIAARGRLAFAVLGGTRVAGICIVPARSTAWVSAIGVRGGDRDLVRRGAAAAAYATAFDLARAAGFERLDFGRTSPFVNDGLYRYKRKWGMEPVRDPMVQLSAVWIDPNGEAPRRAFAREPVQVDVGDGLRELAG